MPASIFANKSGARAARQGGFSLIEVLVAFMILAMALTVIFRIFSGGLRNVSLAQDYARAELIAESKLSVVGISEPLQVGVTTGEWGDNFRWEREIEPYQPWLEDKKLKAPVDAYRITVNVSWQHSAGDSQIQLSSIRLKHRSNRQRRG